MEVLTSYSNTYAQVRELHKEFTNLMARPDAEEPDLGQGHISEMSPKAASTVKKISGRGVASR